MTALRYVCRVEVPGHCARVTSVPSPETLAGVTAYFLGEVRDEGARIDARIGPDRRAYVRHGGRWLPIAGGVC